MTASFWIITDVLCFDVQDNLAEVYNFRWGIITAADVCVCVCVC